MIFDPAEEVSIDKETKLHILSLFQADATEVVATAAVAGDSDIIFSYLSKHPEEVTKSCTRVHKKQENWPTNDCLIEAFPLTLLKKNELYRQE